MIKYWFKCLCSSSKFFLTVMALENWPLSHLGSHWIERFWFFFWQNYPAEKACDDVSLLFFLKYDFEDQSNWFLWNVKYICLFISSDNLLIYLHFELQVTLFLKSYFTEESIASNADIFWEMKGGKTAISHVDTITLHTIFLGWSLHIIIHMFILLVVVAQFKKICCWFSWFEAGFHCLIGIDFVSAFRAIRPLNSKAAWFSARVFCCSMWLRSVDRCTLYALSIRSLNRVSQTLPCLSRISSKLRMKQKF